MKRSSGKVKASISLQNQRSKRDTVKQNFLLVTKIIYGRQKRSGYWAYIIRRT